MLAKALAGVRVLDASRVLAGPLAGQLLADLGAEVLKLEDPSEGDETRAWGPPFEADGMSAYFASVNRGKRGITLNLKDARGRALFHQLAAKCDVVLVNFRADSAAALGADAASLLGVNPRVVVVTLSGYGSGSKWGKKAGYDFAVQGVSGMMAMTGPKDGAPCKFSVAIADVLAGHYAALAVLAALRERDRSGQGIAVEVALVDCAVAGMVNVAQAFLSTGKPPERQGNAHLQIVPYELFQTADDWLVLAVGNDRQWQAFVGVAAALAPVPGLADPSFARNPDRVRQRGRLVPLVAAALRGQTAAAWRAALDVAGVPNGPVWSFAELFASDLAAERKLRIRARRRDGTEISLLRSPLVEELVTAPPPARGEHTDQVLSGILGLEAGAIARLRAEGVL